MKSMTRSSVSLEENNAKIDWAKRQWCHIICTKDSHAHIDAIRVYSHHSIKKLKMTDFKYQFFIHQINLLIKYKLYTYITRLVKTKTVAL